MPVLWWAYLRQLQHEAQRHADQSGDETGHRDSLPSIQMPELCKELLRGDSIQVSWGEDNGACCLMDKRFLASQHTDLTVQRITGVHWDTIKRIQKEIMDETLADRRRKLLREGYRPEHLAVDEFAIHKGHSYATCVNGSRHR